jgi:hypothetical protein
LVGAAVNVTLVPEHNVVVLEVMLTDGVTGVVTLTVMALDKATSVV